MIGVVTQLLAAVSLSSAHQGALQMAARGFPVFPLHGIVDGKCTCGDIAVNPSCTPGKHPHFIGSMATATIDPAMINMWFEKHPTLNYGVRLGLEMRSTGKMPVVVDVDRYKPGGAEALDALETIHGRLPETAEVITGAGGSHCYYWADCTLRFAGTMGKNIDLKANGYVVGPGSRHMTGRCYDWEASSDLFNGQEVVDLPKWVIDNFSKSARHATLHAEVARNAEPMLAFEQVAIKHDLSVISAGCSRDEWLKILMALHSRSQSKEMFSIADEWSQTCLEKYDAEAVFKAWHSFKPNGGITYDYVLYTAREVIRKSVDLTKLLASLEPMRAAVDVGCRASNIVSTAASRPFIVSDTFVRPVQTHSDIPPHLLTVPGKLSLMVDWTNATSSKPQPMFAVQAALALGSVAMGRKFRTTQHNWPTLYFLNIALSGAGKEHAKTANEQVLRAAKFSALIGPSEYTSDSAVDSTLLCYPTHLAFIDEFGLMLKAGNAKNNANGGTARKRLMEVFGRCHSTLQPKAYSTAGLTKQNREALGPRMVENPALTLVGMTTPGTFYEAVGSGALTDGFLNRFIIVESDLGRQPSQDIEDIAPPEQLVQWVRDCRLKGTGDIVGSQLDALHNDVPKPTILDFTIEARRLYRDLEMRCNARMDVLEEHGMAEMYTRVREISMRVSLIVARSCESDVINADHARWAIDYVTYWADRAISSLAANVADTPFAALCNDVANLIQKAGRLGLTVPELSRKSAKFKGADRRLRTSVFDNLASDRAIRQYETKSPSGRGRPRAAYIAPEFTDQQH
jgi:hypothetical protein